MDRDNHDSDPAGGPAGDLRIAAAVTRLDQVADEYLASIADFGTDDGGYAVPGEFVVASARNPD